MDQKYKIFTRAAVFEIRQQEGRCDKSISELMEIFLPLFHSPSLKERVLIKVPNPEEFFQELMKQFRMIEAAGGYVLNSSGMLLMIYRRGYWDLPKGKIDPGESPAECARREVAEECGISPPEIENPHPYCTYHLYDDGGEKILKKTYWYQMKHVGEADLKPQHEEDIAEARWVELPLPDEISSGCYPLISEVVQFFSGLGVGGGSSLTSGG
ncbi:MAG: hypothetical protein Kow0075_12480 [Salibacteraceae bacterium]